MTTRKFSLRQQIAEVDRELRMRATVYPRLVRKGEMRQSESEYLIDLMQGVKATLEMIEQHEDAVRALAARGWVLSE